MPKFIDFTGERFGSFTVTSRSGTNVSRRTIWLCRCVCGVEKLLPSITMIRARKLGLAISCPCSRSARLSGPGDMAAPYCRQTNVCDCGDHAFAGLTKGRVVLLDTEDVGLVGDKVWQCRAGYAVRTDYIDGVKIFTAMHRIILGAGEGELADHRNHDRADNRRENLRICDEGENARNKSVRRGRKFKGVDFVVRDNLWRARIQSHRKMIQIGYFKTAQEAARAYDKYAERLHGDFSHTNAAAGCFARSGVQLNLAGQFSGDSAGVAA